ncbi:MAG: CBS domain-containing protein [Desulfurococcales archaeon]|nr:CBS domain-containing protein [Desulfurococcales archaeon]MCE4626475.1 CBS domain-containing protein [Desulfurococcales archaeon]
MFEDVTLRTLKEAMTDDFPVLDKDYSLAAALEEMEKYKTDRIILTEKGEIRGILTLRDVIFKLGTVRTKQTTPSALHASSFMNSPVFTLKENDTVLRAVKEMTTRSITSIPVTANGKPVGLLSRWELAEMIRDAKDSNDVVARTVMRTPPVAVTLQTKILHTRQLIFQHNLSVIPVMEEGSFVGVVGIDEIALLFIKYYELARGEPKRITPLKYVVVADAVKLRPPRVDPDTPLSEVADRMLKHRYRAVVVVDNDKPIGIISGVELARMLTI